MKFLVPRSLLALTGLATLITATPARAESPRPISPWGIGSSAMRSKDHPVWIPQMAAIGIKELRSGRSSWGAIEPEQGNFDWAMIDAQLDYLDSQGIRTGALVLGTNGKWNKKDNPKGLPVNSLPEWSNYITKLVEHTKGRIDHFEVWNEPPNGTAGAPPSDYAKVVAATYDAVKKANPNAKVGLAAKSAHINYLDQVIAAGAKDHFDYVTLHPYEVLGCVQETPGTESIYMNILPTLRKMLKARNPAKAAVPLWLTEIGYDSKRGVEKQASAVIKAYTMGLAQGMECIMWFEGIDGDSGPLGLLTGKGEKRPAYIALAELIKALGPEPKYAGWILLNEKHYGFVFEGPKGAALVTWAATREPDTVDFGKPVEIINPLNATTTKAATWSLTTVPIIVQGISPALISQAGTNKSKPFPWGGDYTNAKEVSVTMGQTNIEKGLHTKSAESIARDVVAYGGGSREGSIPGGNVFIVDPNFLSYDKVPIEISMVVRRNEANDPAAITLEYESTGGYKKLPPQEIPDNSEWRTLTWKIDDPQFVNTWAFSFRVNSGKYFVQKVAVKKL